MPVSGVPEFALPTFNVTFETFNSIFTAPGGRVPLPGDDEVNRGQHNVSLTGDLYRDSDGDWVQFWNSWGPDWGEHGLGYLSRDYLDQYLVEAWLVRDAGLGPSPLTLNRLAIARNHFERSTIWLTRNRRSRRRGRRANCRYEVVVYETISEPEDCHVEVVQVRTGFGIRVGWAHLFHLNGNPKTSLLNEFFVWPSFRRQGYGTILESAVTERARASGATRLQVLFHEMDAQPIMRSAGERFATRSGYQWTWNKSFRPQVEAVGEKIL